MSMTPSAVNFILDMVRPLVGADVYLRLPLGVEVRQLERGRYLILRTNERGQTASATPIYGEYDLLETLADIFADYPVTALDVEQLGWDMSA